MTLSNQNWAYVGVFEDPDEMWHVWKAIFNSVVDKHAPFRKKRVRTSKSPWISSHLEIQRSFRLVSIKKIGSLILKFKIFSLQKNLILRLIYMLTKIIQKDVEHFE